MASGLAYMLEEDAAPHLASGALVSMLEDWCQPFPWLLSLLSESAATASRPFGFDRCPSHVMAWSRSPAHLLRSAILIVHAGRKQAR